MKDVRAIRILEMLKCRTENDSKVKKPGQGIGALRDWEVFRELLRSDLALR